MPFGLINNSTTFQGYINKILAKKVNVFVIIYLDYIFIYTENKRKEYIEAIRWILNPLQKHSLYANFKKCRFYQDELRFLGYIVSRQGI